MLGAGAAAQQVVGLVAPVGAEIFVQEINHRPEVPAFLDIDLEQVAQIVERGRGEAEKALLFDARRLGVALDDDEAAQHGAIFPRRLLPRRFAGVFAAGNLAAFNLRREQHAPAIFRHLHIIELRPALGIDADGGAQIDGAALEFFRDQIVPPVDVAGMPFLQRLQHAPVGGEADIVGDQRVVVDVERVGHGCFLFLASQTRRMSNSPRFPVP
jgi:hypothetical protein